MRRPGHSSSVPDPCTPDGIAPVRGKERMMVYVPAVIRRAVKTWAVDSRQSASEVFVEAVREYLEARGVDLSSDDQVMPSEGDVLHHPVAPPADPGEGLTHQERRIEELLLRLDEVMPRILGGGAEPRPAGTKVAEGMKVLLEALRAAGAPGLDNEGIRAAMTAGSVSTGSAETAKAVLRDARLIRKVDQRWVLGVL